MKGYIYFIIHTIIFFIFCISFEGSMKKSFGYSIQNGKDFYCSDNNCSTASYSNYSNNTTLKQSSLYASDEISTLQQKNQYKGNLIDAFKLSKKMGIYMFGGYIHGIGNDIKRQIYNGADYQETYNSNSSGVPGLYIGTGFNVITNYLSVGVEVFYSKTFSSSEIDWKIKNTEISSSIDMNYIYGSKFRLGTVFFDTIMPYGTIGAAVINATDSTTYVGGASREKDSSIGMVYGGGIDIFLSNNFFVRVEYQEMAFDSKYMINNVSFSSNNTQVYGDDSSIYRSIICGIGYKF